MNYQVGTICYSNRTEAENAYYSQVIPTITANGKLHQLTKTQNGWQYNGQTLTAPLPECSIAQNFADGNLIGWGLLSILIVIWGIKRLQYILRV